MRTICHALTGAFYLVGQAIAADATTAVVDSPVDTIAVVDVSGSMSYDLPQLKREIGNMLPRILRAGDTFSLIYFSGPGQCAVLVDQMPVRGGGDTLADISAIQATLASLSTIGLTCFVDPLNLLADFAARMKAERPRSLRAGLFGSDGYDNTSGGAGGRRAAIMTAVARAVGPLDRWTTLGVGYGCDQGMLQEMAAVGGGTFMFSDDVSRYARNFEVAANRRPDGARRKVVRLGETAIDSLAFTVAEDGAVGQHRVDDGRVSVPENAGTIWYLSESPVGMLGEQIGALAQAEGTRASEPVTAAYAALVLFAQRARRKPVRALAYGLGDARLANLAATAFGPQRYNALAEVAAEAVKGAGRFAEGACDGAEPDPNAYTVLEALAALKAGDNRIVPDHATWTYRPVTRGRRAAAIVLTAADTARIAELTSALTAGADISAIDTVVAELQALKNGKGSALKWSYLPRPGGYKVDGLVFASEEANVSVRIVRDIEIDAGPALQELPDEILAYMPGTLAWTRYQSFTVITGRVLNCPSLPVILDESTWETYRRAGLVAGPHRREVVVVDFSRLPMINDGMIDGLNAADVVRTAYALEGVKAQLKVGHEVKKLLPREASKVAAWLAGAGVEGAAADTAAAWLAKLGVTDNGYQPPSTTAPKTGDTRRSWLLDVGIPGLSDLPSASKVRVKLAKIDAWQETPTGKEPKLTRGEALVAPAVRALDAFCRAHAIDTADISKLDDVARGKLAAFVADRTAALEPQRAALLHGLSQAAITAICGGEWFADMTPGETDIEVELGGEKLGCKVDIRDVDIAL